MEPDSSQDPRIGKVLQDRYRVLGTLDEGATGTVYKGERIKLGRQVAIKFLHPRYAIDPAFMKRFEREALAMSRLGHPHCVSVLDFGVDEGPYIVMDYVTGQTLRELLDRGRVPMKRALQIVRQVLAGLAHAHRQGIVHRDIKPANIMLTEATGTGDHVRILDFGLATLRDSGLSGDVSESWLVVGTPAYMSPEQSMGGTVDQRADVYGVGVMLFHLLTGEKPYDADEAWETLRMHREEAIPKLAKAGSTEVKFPKGLQELIDSSMAKDPDDRYQSAAEFAEALDAVVESGAVPEPLAYAQTARHSAEPPPLPKDVAPKPKGGSLFGTLLLLLLLAGAAAAGGWYWQNRDGSNVSDSAGVAHVPPDAGAGTVAVVAPGPADAASITAAPLDAAVTTGAVDAGEDDGGYILNLPPDELDEPVAAIEEDVEDDSPPQEPPEPAEPAPIEVNSVEDAKQLIDQGRREEAIDGLRALKRKNPNSAYIPYLLGNLYFEKRWWSIGMQSYKDAIENNRDYRNRSVLNKNVIRALGSDKTKSKAISLYLNDIGRSGLKYLRRAAKSDRNSKVRSRASWLVKKLSSKNKRKRR